MSSPWCLSEIPALVATKAAVASKEPMHLSYRESFYLEVLVASLTWTGHDREKA